MRPVTLKGIVTNLERIKVGEFDVRSPRSKEILGFLRRLGLVFESDELSLTSDGEAFINAYRNGNAAFIHEVLMRLEEYRRVYDCLLYTSPSPRDLSTSRMPSSA